MITSRSGALRFDVPRTNPAKPRKVDAAPATVSEAVVSDAEMKQRDRDNMNETNWRVHGPGGAADLLGMRPTTLTSRIKRMQLKRTT